MIKLLVIADDFTGALDTGVQFSKCGVKTQVFTKCQINHSEILAETEVLVVDTETRPLTAKKAYEIVYELSCWAKRLGIKTILKKTDSALRGNIGRELEAVSDAMGGQPIFFMPAYPQMQRITKNGIHYINGELLEDSVFGKDPFEPVKYSAVEKIIKQQSTIDVVCLEHIDQWQLKEHRQVVVLDCESNDDIRMHLQAIPKQDVMIYSGCAGLAGIIPEIIDLQMNQSKGFVQTEGLVIACGSLNEITKRQIEYATQHGVFRARLSAPQKADQDYYDTEEGHIFLAYLHGIYIKEKLMIIDTFDQSGEETALEWAIDHGVSKEKMRFAIAKCHGKIVEYLISQGINATILMTGGDTLMGFMKQIACDEIIPLCEIEKGVAVSKLYYQGQWIQVISKSGGFGDAETFIKIAKKVVREDTYEICNDTSCV